MKILSQNFSQGLSNKIDLATKLTTHYKPYVFIIQECEITTSINLDILKIPGYQLVSSIDITKPKARLAAYLKEADNFSYEFNKNTETVYIYNNQVDIIGVYRPFKNTETHTNISTA